MQTIAGIRITDRVTVQPVASPIPGAAFEARFDGELIGRFGSERLAAHGAKAWLVARSERREAEKRVEEERAKFTQERLDELFLTDIETRLGLDYGELERLIEIVVRRAKS